MAGIVTAAGSDVLHPRVGDRVTGFCFDNLATYQRTLATLVQRIPDDAVLDVRNPNLFSHGNVDRF